MQSDNTVKEIRNQYGCKMLACMSQAGLWGVTSCHHLQVGHTHEDIDAIFSLVAVALRTCQSLCMQTPMDVVKRIESKLGHLWTKKGLHFSIHLVDTVTRICFQVWNFFITVFSPRSCGECVLRHHCFFQGTGLGCYPPFWREFQERIQS